MDAIEESKRRRRLSPAERRRHIVDGAIEFFAEAGFSGRTLVLTSQGGMLDAADLAEKPIHATKNARPWDGSGCSPLRKTRRNRPKKPSSNGGRKQEPRKSNAWYG